MKNIKKFFPWAVRPSEDEFSQMWQDAIFVFDTNFLLDLYRVSDSTRQDYLKILEKVQDRIWIPERVANEFFTNREKVIASNKKILYTALSNLNKMKQKIEKLPEELFPKEPKKIKEKYADKLLNDTDIKELKDILVKIQANLESEIEEEEKKCNDDSILESIDWLFDESKIGKSFKEEELQEFCEKGEKRFEMSIPPGFKDNKKQGVKRYGDFLIWQQILDFAKQKSKPIIFITNDTKEDWWDKDGNNITSPHIELRREFYQYTKQRFWMYRTERFLKFAEEYLSVEVDENSINETREIAEEDIWEDESDSDFEPPLELIKNIVKPPSLSLSPNLVEQISTLSRPLNVEPLRSIVQNMVKESEMRQEFLYKTSQQLEPYIKMLKNS